MTKKKTPPPKKTKKTQPNKAKERDKKSHTT